MPEELRGRGQVEKLVKDSGEAPSPSILSLIIKHKRDPQ